MISDAIMMNYVQKYFGNNIDSDVTASYNISDRKLFDLINKYCVVKLCVCIYFKIFDSITLGLNSTGPISF